MALGKVYLVGAGPGDPGLITQKGLDCLTKADAVVYDRLLDERLLQVTRPDAEKICAGKSATEHVMEQAEINHLLVTLAQKHNIVVRLKGGDPFVLGRGGEEAQELASHGVPFEIVPGITSSVAVPAYAGIPVTHRGLASSFAVVTGHEDPTKKVSDVNWAKLATAVDTIVILMGLQNLPGIMAELVKNGRDSRTPVAVIKDGTRPMQITVTGTIDDIVVKVNRANFTAPVVIIVGKTVTLRNTLSWFENRPLFGKTVLVTRARHQAGALSQMLTERGARAIELPAIEILPELEAPDVKEALAGIRMFQWIIFTSVNGVAAFFQVLNSLGQDARAFSGIKICAIGPATAEALMDRGIRPDFQPKPYTTDGILRGLASKRVAGQKFLLPRTDIADEQLAAGLVHLGATVNRVTVYRTATNEQSAGMAKTLITSHQIDAVTFTSSSTVSNFIAALNGEIAILQEIKIACIGPKTAATAEKTGLKVDILAEEQTVAGLVAAIERYFTRRK